jgi:hypothetical protein
VPAKSWLRIRAKITGGLLAVDDSIRLRRTEYLLGTLLSLVVADGLISQFLIKGGIGQEGNPFLRTIVTEGNFLIVKMCGAIICVLLLWNMARRLPRLIFIVSICLVSLYTAILFWNIAIFLAFGV